MTTPVETASPAAPCVLIFTWEPWIFQALRRHLGAINERRGASGQYYDEGVFGALRGTWNVALALTAHDFAGIEDCFADQAPTLVLVVAEVEQWNLCSVPSRVLVKDQPHARFETTPEALNLLKRVQLRGEWPVTGVESEFLVVDEWPTSDVNTAAVFASAARRRTAVVPVLTSPPKSASIAWLEPFVAGLLLHLDPSSLQRPAPASPAPDAPPKIAPIPVDGFLHHVAMRSLRMFRDLTWSAPAEHAGWHVVLGDNASGKTSLLRAIALCLLDRGEREALRQSWSSWLRSGDEHGEVSVTLQPDDASSAATALTLSLQRVAPAKPGDAATVDVTSSERLAHTGFLAAYGPFRRFTGGDAEWVKGFKDHPRLQRVLTLFDERAALSDAIEWLKDLWVRARTITPQPPEADFLKALLAFINDTEFLPDGVLVEEPDADGVWCRDGNGLRVPLIDLSDGYRSVLSLSLDLLRHLAAAYGHANVFERDPHLRVAVRGVVLVDEVDAHLHPRWQQRIGAWFKRQFPRVQFITATHSAIVCQAADSVLLLPTPGSETAPRMATREELNRLRYGNLLDAFGTGVFGLGVEQSADGRARLDRLAALNLKELDEGLSPDEEVERAELRATLPSRAGAMRGRG